MGKKKNDEGDGPKVHKAVQKKFDAKKREALGLEDPDAWENKNKKGKAFKGGKVAGKGTVIAGKGTIVAGKGAVKGAVLAGKGTVIAGKGAMVAGKAAITGVKAVGKTGKLAANVTDEVLGTTVYAAGATAKIVAAPVLVGAKVAKGTAGAVAAPVLYTGKAVAGTSRAVTNATRDGIWAAQDAVDATASAITNTGLRVTNAGLAIGRKTGVEKLAKVSTKGGLAALKAVGKFSLKTTKTFTLRSLQPLSDRMLDLIIKDGLVIPDLSLEDLMGEVYAHSETNMVHQADVEAEAAKVVSDNLLGSLLNQFEACIEEWDLALEYLNMQMNQQNHNPEILSHIDHINEYKYDVYITAAHRLDEFYEDLEEADELADIAREKTGTEGLEAVLDAKMKKKQLLIQYRTDLLNFEEKYAKNMFTEVTELQKRSPLAVAYLKYWKQHDRMAVFSYNTILDLDKQIDREITRMPLNVLCELRRELTSEIFSHGVGRMPHFVVPSMIPSHTFLRAPDHDDSFWTYRVDDEEWKFGNDSVRAKPSELKEWVTMPDVDANLVALYAVCSPMDIAFYDTDAYLEYATPMLCLHLADLTGVVLSVSRDDPVGDDGLLQRTELKLITEYACWRVKFPPGDPERPDLWWHEMLAARKYAIMNDDDESTYARHFNRRLFPRNAQAARPGELPLWKQMEGMAMATRDASGTAFKAGALAMLMGTDAAAGMLIDAVHGSGKIVLKGTIKGSQVLAQGGLMGAAKLTEATLKNSVLFTKSGLQLSRSAVKDVAGISTRATLIAGAAAMKLSSLVGAGAFAGGKLATKVGLAGLLATKDGAMKGSEAIGMKLWDNKEDAAKASAALLSWAPKLGLKAGAAAAVGTVNFAKDKTENMKDARLQAQIAETESAIKTADELIAMKARVDARNREQEIANKKTALIEAGDFSAESWEGLGGDVVDEAEFVESENLSDARRRIAGEKNNLDQDLHAARAKKATREQDDKMRRLAAQKARKLAQLEAKKGSQEDMRNKKKLDLEKKKAELEAKKAARKNGGVAPEAPEEVAHEEMSEKDRKKADLEAKKAALLAKKAARMAGGTVAPADAGPAATGNGEFVEPPPAPMPDTPMTAKEKKKAELEAKKAALAAKKNARKGGGKIGLGKTQVGIAGLGDPGEFEDPEMAPVPDKPMTAKEKKKAELEAKKAALAAKKNARKGGGKIGLGKTQVGFADTGPGQVFADPEMAPVPSMIPADLPTSSGGMGDFERDGAANSRSVRVNTSNYGKRVSARNDKLDAKKQAAILLDEETTKDDQKKMSKKEQKAEEKRKENNDSMYDKMENNNNKEQKKAELEAKKAALAAKKNARKGGSAAQFASPRSAQLLGPLNEAPPAPMEVEAPDSGLSKKDVTSSLPFEWICAATA